MKMKSWKVKIIPQTPNALVFEVSGYIFCGFSSFFLLLLLELMENQFLCKLRFFPAILVPQWLISPVARKGYLIFPWRGPLHRAGTDHYMAGASILIMHPDFLSVKSFSIYFPTMLGKK